MKNIEHERRERRMTRPALGRLCGLTGDGSTVVRWENGSRTPSPPVAARLEEIFGMTLADLLKDHNPADKADRVA